MEEWKDIPNYEGYYQASSEGRVRSLERIVNGRWGESKRKGRVLIPTKSKGYLQVSLSKENKRKIGKVHVLVAMAFLGHVPCGHKIEVDHKDDDKLNNNLYNLQLLVQRVHATKSAALKSTSSKYVGVHWHKQSKRWIASITINNRATYLGCYTVEEDAAEAYQNALAELQ